MNKEGGKSTVLLKKITLISHLATVNEMTETLQMQWQWLDTYGAPTDIKDQQMTSDAG